MARNTIKAALLRDPLDAALLPSVTQAQMIAGSANILVQVALLAAATPGVGLAGLAATFMSSSGAILSSALAVRGRSLTAMWNHMRRGASDGGPSGAEFERFLEDNALDPAIQATILESVRNGLSAVDPAAIKPLAFLSRTYTTQKRAPDDFYRRAASFLVSASKAQVEAARSLFATLERRAPEHDVMLHATGTPPEVRVDEVWRTHGAPSTRQIGLIHFQDGVGLLRLLDAHRLIRQTGGGADEISAFLELETIERMTSVLRRRGGSKRSRKERPT